MSEASADGAPHIIWSADLPALAGTTWTGQTAPSYRPVPLIALRSGCISFAHKLELIQFRDHLAVDRENCAVIAPTDIVASLSATDRDRFCRSNLLIAAAAPRQTFMALLRSSIDATLPLIRPHDLHDDSAGRSAPTARVAGSSDIAAGAILADGAVIGSGVTAGPDLVLAEAARIWDGVRLGRGVRIGAAALIGTRVDAYERHDPAAGDLTIFNGVNSATWSDMPQVGGLTIGDDVRIGAHTIVNRGTLNDTVIDGECRIGDRVIVGHNVRIGSGTAITAGTVICGSATIGRAVWVGPGAVIKNKVHIGDGATIGIGSVIVDDVPAGVTMMPAPALEAAELIALRRLLR